MEVSPKFLKPSEKKDKAGAVKECSPARLRSGMDRVSLTEIIRDSNMAFRQ